MTADSLALLLIAFGGMAAIFALQHDDDDETGSPEPGPDPISTVPSEGDDIITETSDIDFSAPIATLAGDDLVDLPSIAGTDIDLGDGDDTLNAGTIEVSNIDGGDGDDLITYDSFFGDRDNANIGADADGVINGGNGDDTISGTIRNAEIYAGAGDDLIETPVAFHGADNQWAPVYVEGGDGQDTFIVTTNGAHDVATTTDATVIEFGDFTPGQDNLVIDATTAGTGAEFMGVTIEGSGTDYRVAVHFTDAIEPGPLVAMYLNVQTNGTPLTEADIRVITP